MYICVCAYAYVYVVYTYTHTYINAHTDEPYEAALSSVSSMCMHQYKHKTIHIYITKNHFSLCGIHTQMYVQIHTHTCVVMKDRAANN